MLNSIRQPHKGSQTGEALLHEWFARPEGTITTKPPLTCKVSAPKVSRGNSDLVARSATWARLSVPPEVGGGAKAPLRARRSSPTRTARTRSIALVRGTYPQSALRSARRDTTVSAPNRELSLPVFARNCDDQVAGELLPSDKVERVESKLIDAHVTSMAAAARDDAKGNGRQLAAELLGPYQKPRRVNSKVRRRQKRVAALNHDTTRDVVVGKVNRGSVSINEMPLGGAKVQPSWLKRGERLTDGAKHDVVRYQTVEGPALPGGEFPVRYRVTPTTEQRTEAAERMLREQAYKLTPGVTPEALKVVHYHESTADHRAVSARLDVQTATKAQVKRSASRAFGQVCEDCGLNHRGTCM